LHFGENKVQEALDKWTVEKKQNHKINLHMIGRLQTNKVKLAVKLFDYIHSVDSIKLAKKIAEEQNKIKKNIKLFLQVNIENEQQKAGIDINQAAELLKECLNLKLTVLGLMCLPPINKPVNDYFIKLKQKNDELKLNSMSMGMSGDYLEALIFKSDFLRIGTKIFGNRY